MSLLQLFRWGLAVAETLVALPVAYLCILVTTVIVHTRKQAGESTTSADTPEATSIRFAIMIPAHNEEVLLQPLLTSLSEQAYPRDLYTIYVIADNCTDRTAEIARSVSGIRVYERFDPVRRSKGYALEWALQRLEEARLIYDAYIIFDADSLVEPNFLQIMARESTQGREALQGRYDVLNATESPSTILRWIALTLINYVRPFGRSILGFSSRLTGNGMCFSHDLLRRFPWSTYGHSEDYEYYLMLVQHGERIHFVPDAVVRAHMPTTFADMRTQDIRWESGFYQKIVKVSSLLSAGRLLRTSGCYEATIELLVPPLSFMVGWCAMLLVLSLLLWSPVDILLNLLIIGSLAYYIGSAFYLLRPARTVYKALLLNAPRFILWKLWVLLVLKWRKKHNSDWIRTSRPTAPVGMQAREKLTEVR